MKNWCYFFSKMPSLFIGLFIFSAGIVSNLNAGLGMMPWGVLNVGLEKITPLTLGEVSQVVGLIVLILGWYLGFSPGFGTLVNMYIIGIYIDWILSVQLIPIPTSLPMQFGLLFLSIGFLGIGTLLYFRTGLGAGPRDGLMMGLVKKTGRSISTIRGFIEITVLIIGYLLGGPVGFGTLISAMTIGYSIQLAFSIGGYNKYRKQLNIYELIEGLRGKEFL